MKKIIKVLGLLLLTSIYGWYLISNIDNFTALSNLTFTLDGSTTALVQFVKANGMFHTITLYTLTWGGLLVLCIYAKVVGYFDFIFKNKAEG